MTAPTIDNDQSFRVTSCGRTLYITDSAWRAQKWADTYEIAHPGTVTAVKPC